MRKAIGIAVFLSLAAGSQAIAQHDGSSRSTGGSVPASTGVATVGGLTQQELTGRDIRLINMSRPTGDNQMIGALAQSPGMVVGLGLFRVQRTDAIDPNRNNPMRDSYGRTQRVAAVGMSLRF